MVTSPANWFHCESRAKAQAQKRVLALQTFENSSQAFTGRVSKHSGTPQVQAKQAAAQQGTELTASHWAHRRWATRWVIYFLYQKEYFILLLPNRNLGQIFSFKKNQPSQADGISGKWRLRYPSALFISLWPPFLTIPTYKARYGGKYEKTGKTDQLFGPWIVL